MKNAYILLLLLAFPLLSYSQWTTLNSGVIGNLRDVYFVNGSVGFVTDSATLLKTTDGGQTWSPVVTGSSDYIFSVWFTSTTTGFIAGNSIMKTTDQGATWTVVEAADPGHIFTYLFFVNPTVGYAIKRGENSSYLIKTADGGNTWSTNNTNFSYVEGLFFYSPDSGMFTSFATFDGYVNATANGGQSFYTPLAGPYQQFTFITGTKTKRLFTFDNGTDRLYYSYNGGKKWHHYVINNLDPYGAMQFTSDSVGWAIGFSGGNSSILHSTNAGLSWQQDTAITGKLYYLQFPSADTGYAVGSHGQIIKYVAPCPLTATIFPAGISACKGTEVTFTCGNAGSNFSYQWEKDGVAIPGATNQTYINSIDEAAFNVVVTSSFGCSDTSDAASIDRLKKPKAIITPLGNLDICTTGSVNLQGSSGNNFLYQWKKNGSNISSATNQVYNASTTGSYRVRITNSNDCSKTSKITTVTTSCKETSMLQNKDAISAYPNPTSGRLTIELSSEFNSVPLEITITDMLGKVIQRQETTSGENYISINLNENVMNGIYLLTIQSPYSSAHETFEVQK